MAQARCWVVTDGAAGNRRQALALAAALGYADAREWRLRARAPWRWLAPRRLPSATAAFGSEFTAALASPPELVIGCGRQAALATRLLRARGARAVQILDPRIDPRHWDLLLAPRHDRCRGDNVIAFPGSLHPVNAAWLATARARWPQLGELPGPRTALLLGGAIARVPIDRRWWADVQTRLRALAVDPAGLMVCASRRTPAWLCAAAADLGAGLCWRGADDGENPYPGVLAWADRILVSPDSVNMLSEACATGVAVYAPGSARARGRQARFLAELYAGGHLLADTTTAPASVPLHALPAVAAEVRRRLGLP